MLEDRFTPAAAGTPDPTFGNGGVELISSGKVVDLATLPDGRILALLQSTASPSSYSLERLSPGGTPDPTFGTGGVAALPASYSTVTALPDGGALLLAGDSITRVTPAGALDPTFGTAGTVAVPNVGSPVVQPDGKILVLDSNSSFSTLNGATVYTGDLIVERLAANGQFDPTFGTGGVATVPFPVGQFDSAVAESIALQPDGRVIIGGHTVVTGHVVSTSPTEPSQQWRTEMNPVVVRLTSTGQLDPTFGTGGRVRITFPQEVDTGVWPSPGGQDLAVSTLPNGEIELATAGDLVSATSPPTSSSGFVGLSVLLTADGTPDPSYGSAGLAITSVTGTPVVAIDPENRVIFSNPYLIYRLTPSGSTDTGFGPGGQFNLLALPLPSGQIGRAPSIAFQPNGNILLGSLVYPQGTGLLAELLGSSPPAGFVPATTGTVVAGGAATGTFQVLNPASGTFANAGTVTAFPGFGGNVRVATADVNGDGTPDYVVGAGPGGAPEVTVYDGKTGAVLADFPAFEPTFTGGVFVAAADLTGDGRADVIVTPDQGGGPRVVIFSVAGGAATMQASFFGINDPSFRGGARVAAGDLNADGTPDLAVAAGFLGGPRVALWNGKTVLSGAPAELVNDFFAFPGSDATTLRNGAYVAVGDLTGGGADLIFGGGPGGAPRVFALSAAQVVAGNVAAAQASPVANFFVAGNAADRGGARVAVTDAGGAGADDLVVGSGAGDPARVRVYTGGFGAPGEPSAFQDVGVFGGAALPDGVYVG